MSEHAEVAEIAIVIFFIFAALTLGGLVSEVTKKINIPYPAAVFLVGIAIGWQYTNIHNHLIKRTVEVAIHMDANSNMTLLLPALVFSSAFNADIYIMK
jgi:NhaP-type Na+/H+ or K+/H+ antiporter